MSVRVVVADEGLARKLPTVAQQHDALTHEILRIAAMSEGPVGAGTIYFGLRDLPDKPSTPTIGRRLRELEASGALRKVGVEGRCITSNGARLLHVLEQEQKIQVAGAAVLGTLRQGSRSDMLDLLVARRPIEREAARLAATKRSASDLRDISAALRAQESALASGKLAVEEDILFHEMVAHASQNAYLTALVSLLRHHGPYSFLVNEIRATHGQRRGVNHRQVFEAIRQRDSEAAELAMDTHIQELIAEVKRFYSRQRGAARRSAR